MLQSGLSLLLCIRHNMDADAAHSIQTNRYRRGVTQASPVLHRPCLGSETRLIWADDMVIWADDMVIWADDLVALTLITENDSAKTCRYFKKMSSHE